MPRNPECPEPDSDKEWHHTRMPSTGCFALSLGGAFEARHQNLFHVSILLQTTNHKLQRHPDWYKPDPPSTKDRQTLRGGKKGWSDHRRYWLIMIDQMLRDQSNLHKQVTKPREDDELSCSSVREVCRQGSLSEEYSH